MCVKPDSMLGILDVCCVLVIKDVVNIEIRYLDYYRLFRHVMKPLIVAKLMPTITKVHHGKQLPPNYLIVIRTLKLW